jgi:multiple sugar transport system permease protein
MQVSRRARRQLEKALIYIALTTITAVMVFPIYWTFVTAFKFPRDAFTYPPKYLPYVQFEPTLFAWRDVGLIKDPTQRGTHDPTSILNTLRNSVITAVGSTAVSVILGSLAAYGLARFEFKRWKNRDIAFFILSQRMLPPIVLVIPYFILYTRLGLIDTWHGLIIAHTVANLPFVVWIMRGFFRGIPKELEDSARIDGCSHFQALRKIILPLSLPGLAAITLTFRRAQTFPTLVAGLTHGSAALWWDISAMLLLAIVPVFIFIIIFQRYIVAGLTLGALK